MPLSLGTRVLSRFGGGEQEFPGTISASYSDNTYSIDYDDGDTEDRVARSFIRILKNEHQVEANDQKETLLLLEKAKEENRVLKNEIAQLSALIDEEDSETEKLMVTLNASLTESRRVQTEKDEELRKAAQEIEELKERQNSLKVAVSKGPSVASLNNQIDALKKDLLKAQEAEASARRAHQQTKKEIKLSSDQLVQNLTDQINDERREHQHQMKEFEKQFEERILNLQLSKDAFEQEKISHFEEHKKILKIQQQQIDENLVKNKNEEEVKVDEDKTKNRSGSLSMSEEDIETLKEALNETDARAEEWERKHKELQVLSEQAYEILQEELSNKDQKLVEMHEEAARLQRETNTVPTKLNTKLADQAAAFADRAEKRALQEATRETDMYKAEMEKYQGKVNMLESEREHLCKENRLAKEKVESLTVELDGLRSTSVVPGSGIPETVKEEELAKEVKRWMRKYNELTDLSDDAYTILSSQLRERDEVAQELNQSLQQAELEINDFQNTIDRLSAELEESHAAAELAGRLAEKALHDKHTAHVAAHAERERAERAEIKLHENSSSSPQKQTSEGVKDISQDQDEGEEGDDKVSPLVSDEILPSSSEPEATNELTASLNKLKAQWNGSNEGGESVPLDSSPTKLNGQVDHNSSLFANFTSPLTKQSQLAATQSPEGPPSPAALATQAAKKHLTALEKELKESLDREGSLRDQLVLARAEIRKLKSVVEGEGSNGEGLDDGEEGRGFCGAGLLGGEKAVPSGVVEYEVVKENVRRLSQVLMSGDAPSEAVAEYDKWETMMAAHPDYLAERRADLDAFLAKHSDRNNAALEATRRFVPPDIWNISFQTFSAGAGNMPEKLIKHTWENKILWWVRLEPKCIAKVHIADLRSKYIFQNLDLTEMRAVMAVIPEQFENDPNGEKESWRTSILETIRAGLSSEEKGTLNKEKIRGKLYFTDGGEPIQGPYDPHTPLHEFSLTTSEAFAPTPQFQFVSRIDDNAELSNRRSSITGETVVEVKPMKRQVEQLEFQKFSENPEMQRRREAFSKDKIMNETTSHVGFHRSMSMSDVIPYQNRSHVTQLFSQRNENINDENNMIHRPKTQWEIERESLALIMAGRDERTAFDPKNTENNGGYADWEIELAQTKAYQQQKAIAEKNEQRQRSRVGAKSGVGGSLLTAGGTLDSHVASNSRRRSHRARNSTGGSGGSSQPWAAARRQHSLIPKGSDYDERNNFNGQDPINQRNERRADLVNKYKL